jgi:O-antigen/teichoic acid export membrane protein
MRFLRTLLKALGLDTDLHKLLFKNTLWGLSGEIVGRAAAAVLVIFVARYLGAVKYGELQFAFSFCALFGAALSMGFPGLMIREVARDKSKIKKYAENIFLIKVILAFASFAALSLFAVFMHKPVELRMLVVLAMVYVILLSFIDFLHSIFLTFDKLFLRTVSRIVAAIFLLGFAFYAIFRQGGVTSIMLAYVVSAGITLIVTLIMAQMSITKFFVEMDWKFWKEMSVKMLPFALFIVIFTVYNRIDMVMLSFMKGEESVGIYAAAFNMYAALQTIPMFVVYAVYPTLSRCFAHDRRQLKILYKQYFWIVLGVGSLAGLFLAVFGKFIVSLLFGEGFAASGTIVQYFGISFAFSSLLLYYTFFYASINEQKIFLQVLMLGVLLGVVLNYLFIPGLGYVGAVIGTIGAQVYEVVLLAVILYMKGYRVLA